VLVCCLLVSICVNYFTFLVKMATIEDFISDPSDDLLERFTKDQLLKLAVHYDVELTSGEKRFKASAKDTLRAVLIDDGVLVTKVVEPRLSLVSPHRSDAEVELRLRVGISRKTTGRQTKRL